MSELPPAIQILPAKAIGTLAVPASKSHTNRALLLAALAKGDSVIHHPLRSDDAEAMLNALSSLGVHIEDNGDHLMVHGTGGFVRPDGPIHCRDSGTTIRFLTAAAALCDFPITITGSSQLCRRPLGPLLDALSGLGAVVTSVGGCPPVTVRGPMRTLDATVDAAQSSQFASALLMALGALPRSDASVTIRNIVSAPYVAMTLDSMRAFSAFWNEDLSAPHVYRAQSAGGYRPADYPVEFDASAAGHVWALAAASAGKVAVAPSCRQTGQPDIRVLAVLDKMGCTVTEAPSGVTVSGPASLRSPGVVNMADWPDMLTTVAVLAALAEGTTHISGAAHARGHETDRISAVATELRQIGANVGEHEDGLTITGGGLHGARIHTYGDHRMAMAFAAAGAVVGGVIIVDPGCVRKTFPGFWDDLTRLGVEWREVRS